MKGGFWGLPLKSVVVRGGVVRSKLNMHLVLRIRLERGRQKEVSRERGNPSSRIPHPLVAASIFHEYPALHLQRPKQKQEERLQKVLAKLGRSDIQNFVGK